MQTTGDFGLLPFVRLGSMSSSRAPAVVAAFFDSADRAERRLRGAKEFYRHSNPAFSAWTQLEACQGTRVHTEAGSRQREALTMRVSEALGRGENPDSHEVVLLSSETPLPGVHKVQRGLLISSQERTGRRPWKRRK